MAEEKIRSRLLTFSATSGCCFAITDDIFTFEYANIKPSRNENLMTAWEANF